MATYRSLCRTVDFMCIILLDTSGTLKSNDNLQIIVDVLSTQQFQNVWTN
jgi:hypothetical protein